MEERRKFVRVRGLQEVVYKLKTSAAPLQAAPVKDLSLVGINLYLRDKLDKGVVVELRLELPDGGKAIFVDGEVIWQTSGHNERFATGIRFHSLEDQMRSRLSKFIFDCAQRIDENREFVRCKLEVEGKCYLLDTPHKKFSVRTLDISRAGMKLQTVHPVENNARMHLSFSLHYDIDVIELDAKVVWARIDSNSGVNEVGIFFTNIEEENRRKIDRYIDRYCKVTRER